MRQISSLHNAFLSLFLVFKIFSSEILPEYIFICPDPQTLIFVNYKISIIYIIVVVQLQSRV